MIPASDSQALRVAMLIQGYPPVLGGAERQLAAIAPLLLAHGVEVHVLTRRPAGLRRFERVAGIDVHRLPAFGSKATASLLYTLSALRQLRRIEPHVLHAHGLFSPSTTALAARRLWGTPILAKPLRGGQLGDVARLNQRRGGRRRLAVLAREIDAFAVISREIDAELEGIGVSAERRLCLPNGVDTRRFRPIDAASRPARRAALRLPPHPLVVFSGRLAPEKGLAALLRLWPRVREKVADASLLILGSGPERAALENLAGPGVVFGDQVDDVVEYLSCADVFVLPSHGEGLSNALLEAMAVGLPVVATNVGGAGDVIRHGESGWLVPPRADDELLAGLLVLLRRSDLSRAMGERARTHVVRHHDLFQQAGRLAEVYRRLARRGPRRDRAVGARAIA